MVGEAFTLAQHPGARGLDHIGVRQPGAPQRKAIEIAPTGSVLVIDCRGGRAPAPAGRHPGSAVAKCAAWRGLVTRRQDCATRPEIARRNFPVYCKAPAAPISLIGHTRRREANVPIACGGVAVYPGDVDRLGDWRRRGRWLQRASPA